MMRVVVILIGVCVMAANCHGQPPPPPAPTSHTVDLVPQKLREQLDYLPGIVFEVRLEPPGEILPLGEHIVHGTKYRRPDGEIVSFHAVLNIRPSKRTEDGSDLLPNGPIDPSDLVQIGTECTIHHPMIDAYFLSPRDYRLSVVATQSPRDVARLGLKEIFQGDHEEVAVLTRRLSQREYPEQDLIHFQWEFDRRLINEGQCITFIAWKNDARNPRPEDPESWDHCVMGQIQFDGQGGFSVLKGVLKKGGLE